MRKLNNLFKAFVYVMLCAFLFVSIGIVTYIYLKAFSINAHVSAYTKHLLPVTLGTVYVLVGSLIIAVPLGVLTGIYLFQNSSKNSKKLERYFYILSKFSVFTLSAMPAVLLGLFAFGFFVQYLKIDHCLLCASLTMAIMIFPTIALVSKQAIKGIPQNLTDASLALGANESETMWRIILPAAFPGIATGIILSVMRVLAESVIIIFVAGGSIGHLPRIFTLNYPFILPDSGRTFAAELYYQVTSYNSFEGAFFIAAILLSIVLLLCVFYEIFQNAYASVNLRLLNHKRRAN